MCVCVYPCGHGELDHLGCGSVLLHVLHVGSITLDVCRRSQPELTVANLPSYLALGRPLLLLFVGSEEEEEEDDEWARRETQAVLREVRAAAGGGGEGGAEGYLPCWIHL